LLDTLVFAFVEKELEEEIEVCAHEEQNGDAMTSTSG